MSSWSAGVISGAGRSCTARLLMSLTALSLLRAFIYSLCCDMSKASSSAASSCADTSHYFPVDWRGRAFSKLPVLCQSDGTLNVYLIDQWVICKCFIFSISLTTLPRYRACAVVFCLSACWHTHISRTTCPSITKFFMHVALGRGSVLLS